MPYTKSQAGIGLGTVLSINTGTVTTPVWTPVGEIKTLSQSGRQVSTDDVTNLESSAKEFIPTLLDSGTWDIAGNRVGADAGQVALEAAFQGLVVTMFQILLPKAGAETTTGDKFAFTALVTDLTYSVAVDKTVSFATKLKVSGLIVLTAGS